MFQIAMLLLVIMCVVPKPAAAQSDGFDGTPRVLVDSTYAVRLAVDQLAEMIRHGSINPRIYSDAELGSAVSALAAAAERRSQPRPHEELGIVWDFGFEIGEIQAHGRDGLRVEARALLATDPRTTSPVFLNFRRQGMDWRLERHENLVPQLNAIAQRLARGNKR